MNRIPLLPLIAVATAVAMSACAAAPRVSVNASSDATPTGQPSSQPSPSNADLPEAPAGIPGSVWIAVLDDLGRRLDRQVTDLAVTTAKAMTWNDGSLGCPKPGQVYTQALVDGFQVVLEVDGERYDYRSSGGDSAQLCEGTIEGG